MHPFLIFLVVIGLVFIFFSYFISERLTSSQNTDADVFHLSELTDEGRKFMFQSIGGQITENAEDIVDKVNDELSQISNEKIIAVSEFSDQILDKINQNHGEVVFMYHMLTEKENELKNLINEINEVKSSIRNEITDTKQLQATELISNKANNMEKINESASSNNSSNNYLSKDKGFEQGKEEIKSSSQSLKSNRRKRKNSKSTMNNPSIQMDTKVATGEGHSMEHKELEGDNKERILQLYNEGKSVIDIAKFLNLGQGEVKLVIDLYKRAKG